MTVQFLLGVAFAAVAWWATTGLILYLDGLPVRTYGASMAGATLLAAAAIAGVVSCAGQQNVAAAYCAFACAIAIWGWVELSFLTGFVTGPRRTGCARGCAGLGHARHAAEAVLYHEFAIVGFAVLVALVTHGRPNGLALETFIVLWVMRLSAKFNLFLGVRNLGESFLPPHLAYLATFLRRRPMNPLFPVSIVAGATVACLIAERGLRAGSTPFESASAGLLSALLGLAVVEHAFMMLPFSLDALWGFSLRARPLPVPRTRI